MEQDEVSGSHAPGRERFRRTQRLRSPRDFQRVRRLGRHVSSPLLTLSYARQAPQKRQAHRPDEERPPSGSAGTSAPSVGAQSAAPTTDVVEAPTRIGFSVSKRVGGAVVRNRVKRRLREAVRHTLADLPPSWDIIIGARPPAATADYATLDTAMRELLARAGLAHRKSLRGMP